MSTAWFTFDNPNAKSRSKYLRGALFRHGYKIKQAIPYKGLANNDLWFHGLSYLKEQGIKPEIIQAMKHFQGQLAFFINGDETDFHFFKIPREIIERTSLFAMNHYQARWSNIPEEFHSRMGMINPIIKPMKANHGLDLADRPIDAMFFGANTRVETDGETSRAIAIRKLKAMNLNFIGGLIHKPEFPAPEELRTTAISQKEHDSMLSQSKICLAFWGNCPLTYRFFEGLSRRNLVMAQSFGSIGFANCGLTPGKHYVELASDLSDIGEQINYYIANPALAQQIADAGHEQFKSNYMYSGLDFPATLFSEIKGSWKHIKLIKQSNIITYKCKSIILRKVNSI